MRRIHHCFLLMAFFHAIAIETDAQRNTTFQSEIDKEFARQDVRGVLVSVVSAGRRIEWSGASGHADYISKTGLQPNQTFRIASVTKTFVAGTILRLWEDGRLKLDDPIRRHISAEHADILRKGGYDPGKITILDLLTHSSGMAEHTKTEKYSMASLKTNHVWTREEQLWDLVNLTKPVGDIGAQFSYSDTGYILLGEIIENITGTTLPLAVEQQLRLKELGMTSIHFEDEKGEFGTSRIHQYMEGEDTYHINPTFDLYGGGGLLASTHDLALFYLYLFEGMVFRKKSTLKRMIEPIGYSTPQPLDYRIGIWRMEIEGLAAYTHSGFWGTQVVYIPKLKTAIAANYSQRWNQRGMAPIIPIIVKELLR